MSKVASTWQYGMDYDSTRNDRATRDHLMSYICTVKISISYAVYRPQTEAREMNNWGVVNWFSPLIYISRSTNLQQKSLYHLIRVLGVGTRE